MTTPDDLKIAVCEYLLGVNRDFVADSGRPLIPPTAINWLGDGVVSAVLPVDGQPTDNFQHATPGEVCWVYVDTENLTDHYCVFGLEWFEERSGPITLRRQKWLLIDEDVLVLPDPHPGEEDDIHSD